MLFHLNLRSTADYNLFLRAKALPRYRCQGHTIDVPDEYVHLLGVSSSAPQVHTYTPEPFLFDYQRDITSIAIRKQKFAIFAQCGLGKTLCLLSYAKHVASILGPNRCVLIVSPLMVVRQTIGEAQRFYGDSLPIQRVPAADLQSFLSTGNGIGITNYEAIREGLSPGQLGSVCLDECFVAGTLVDTPSGPKPIESLNVGDKVCNVVGVDKVIATKYRQMREVAVVKFQDGRQLTCSTNHPVLCRNEWTPVSALVPEDHVCGTVEAMQLFQKGFASIIDGAWVESVEIYKSGSDEFDTICEGKDFVTLYDIEVECHSSFSVSGLAVHNSSLLKSHYGAWGQRLIELGRGLPYKLCLTGTPAPNDRIEYANHAVFLDQFPTINAFLARYFVNRGQTQNRWELKPHALRPFYTSLSAWCIFLENPATYGWKDNVGNIPPINVNIHDVPLTDEQRELIFAAGGNMYGCPSGIKSRAILSQLAKGKYKDRKVAANKPQFIRDLVSTWPEESTIIWCRFNHEQDELEKVFPRAASLRGSTSDEEREQAITAFQRGDVKQLISKDKLIGFGLNLQVATRQVFSSCEDSWERYHQCVKRSNRIGSTRPLNVHLVVTEPERPMMENVLRKADRVDHDTIEQEKLFSEVGLGLKGVVNV